MLRISKLTDYGVLVLNQLTDVGAIKLSTEDLVAATSLSLPTVRKVMKTLVDGGLVSAQRGANGGYRLARAASQIRMLDVVQAFEGPIALTDCAGHEQSCEIVESCSLSAKWGGVNELLVQFLIRVTLQDLRSPERQEQLIQNTLADTPFISLVEVG